MTAGMLVLLLFMYGALAVALVVFRKDVGRYPGARFVFGITDLWAFALGLSPLLFALSYLIRNNEPAVLLVALIGVPFGIAGTYMAILKNSIEPNLPRWKLFMTTLVGTLLGTYLLPAVTLMVLMFFAFIVALFVMTLPWSLVIPVLVYVIAKAALETSKASRVESPGKALSGEKPEKEQGGG